ncbi:hypothetical protein [Pseudomonas aeruginosa]|uniref:hypothetical protein n=1 Tax=Pseudomonas aeruginosa TaxID=287 RepID=UPI001CD62EA2|nr:hypothetical protein [Pseudomonas aeruginosa]
MTESKICTCPSGDGSLAHPCPAHPAVEQAGGDERDLQGAQGERDGWGPLPIVQVPWNVFDRAVMWVEDRRRYGDDGTIVDDWKALKTIQRAALAQPSGEVVVTKNESGAIVSVTRQDKEGRLLSVIAESQPSPAQAEKAEAERPPQPERYTADVFHPERPYYMAQTSVVRASDFDEFATQYERIVGALRLERQQMDRAFTACINERDAANARLHEVATACATAEQERDAALARTAELAQALRHLLHNIKASGKRIDLGLAKECAEAALARIDYTAPSQAQHSVPEGWRIERSAERIVVMNLKNGAGYAAARDGESGIAESVLYLLAADLLAAAPGKEGV